jgi:hypothetical protein
MSLATALAASELPITSRTRSGSTPDLTASVTPSETAATISPKTGLFTSLTVLPAPTSPQ